MRQTAEQFFCHGFGPLMETVLSCVTSLSFLRTVSVCAIYMSFGIWFIKLNAPQLQLSIKLVCSQWIQLKKVLSQLPLLSSSLALKTDRQAEVSEKRREMEVDCNGGQWEEVCFHCIKPRLCYWWKMNAGRDSDRKRRERLICVSSKERQ